MIVGSRDVDLNDRHTAIDKAGYIPPVSPYSVKAILPVATTFTAFVMLPSRQIVNHLRKIKNLNVSDRNCTTSISLHRTACQRNDMPPKIPVGSALLDGHNSKYKKLF